MTKTTERTGYDYLKEMLKNEQVLTKQIMDLTHGFNSLIDVIDEPLKKKQEVLYTVMQDNAEVLEAQFDIEVVGRKTNSIDDNEFITMTAAIRQLSFNLSEAQDKISKEIQELASKLMTRELKKKDNL